MIKVKNPITAKFLFYYLNDEKKWLKSGTGQPFISSSTVKNFKIPLPPLPIQQKIVSILDTIQSAIEVQEEIIEKTKELKKSMIADLFKYGAPSFRKSLPAGRQGRKLKKTEIGEIPENWEVVRLGEVCEVVRGSSPRPKGDPKYFSKEATSIHWITIADLTKYKQGMFIVNTDEFLTEEGKKKSRFLKKGSFVITNSGTVGIPAFLGIDGCIHDGYLALLNIDGKVNKVFLYYLIDYSRPRLQQIAPRGTQANLNTIIVSNFLVPLPPPPEQREIAEILQTIDQKIEIEKKKKELYEELFKTMLNKIMNQEINVEKIKI